MRNPVAQKAILSLAEQIAVKVIAGDVEEEGEFVALAAKKIAGKLIK